MRCTAIVGTAEGGRCGAPHVVRDFTSSLFPDGPAIRLCGLHARRFHKLTLEAIVDLPGAMERWERVCDDWRFGADCVP